MEQKTKITKKIRKNRTGKRKRRTGLENNNKIRNAGQERKKKKKKQDRKRRPSKKIEGKESKKKQDRESADQGRKQKEIKSPFYHKRNLPIEPLDRYQKYLPLFDS